MQVGAHDGDVIHHGGAGEDQVDSEAWLTEHGAGGIAGGDAAPALCTAGGA